jgi:hypothetical protein
MDYWGEQRYLKIIDDRDLNDAVRLLRELVAYPVHDAVFLYIVDCPAL